MSILSPLGIWICGTDNDDKEDHPRQDRDSHRFGPRSPPNQDGNKHPVEEQPAQYLDNRALLSEPMPELIAIRGSDMCRLYLSNLGLIDGCTTVGTEFVASTMLSSAVIAILSDF